MNQPDPTLPEHMPRRMTQRLQSFWAQALVSVLLAFTGLVLGWQLSEQGKPRLPSATQTSPALPELRPVSSPQPSVQGPGTLPEAQAAVPRTFRALKTGVAVQTRPDAGTDLITLGRMNLDGG